MRTTWVIGAAIAAAIAITGPAQGTDALRKELTALAGSIKDVLAEEKRADVAVGEFTGPPRLRSQFGPGIQKLLIEELQRANVHVHGAADLNVAGHYADDTAVVLGEKRLVVKIDARIVARSGEEKHRLTTRVVKDNTAVAKISAVTAALPPNGDAATRNEAIRQAVERPGAQISGTRVGATPQSPFAVEILAKRDGATSARPRPITLREGQPFVDIAKDELYEIRIHNGARHEAAVTVTVDGVDVFAFSEEMKPDGRPRFTHYFVDPGSFIDVTGWFVTSDPRRRDNVLSFLVTEIGRGAASRLGVTGKTGVITITFAASGQHPTDLPDDDGARNAATAETGFGPARRQAIEEVRRTIGSVREVISIRYAH